MMFQRPSAVLDIRRYGWLVSELLDEDIHVASSVLDRRDAWAHFHSHSGVALSTSFALLHLKEGCYEHMLTACRASPLLLALSGDLNRPSEIKRYALTPAELALLLVIQTIAKSREGDGDDWQPQSETILNRSLVSFEVRAGQWREKFTAAAKPSSQAGVATIVGVGTLLDSGRADFWSPTRMH